MFSGRGELSCRSRLSFFFKLSCFFPHPLFREHLCIPFLTHPLSTNSTHIHLIACATTLDDVYDYHPTTLLATFPIPIPSLLSCRCYTSETYIRVPATPQHPFLLLVQSRPRTAHHRLYESTSLCLITREIKIRLRTGFPSAIFVGLLLTTVLAIPL